MSIYIIEDHLKEAARQGCDYDVTFSETNRETTLMHVRDLDSGETTTYYVTSVRVSDLAGRVGA